MNKNLAFENTENNYLIKDTVFYTNENKQIILVGS